MASYSSTDGTVDHAAAQSAITYSIEWSSRGAEDAQRAAVQQALRGTNPATFPSPATAYWSTVSGNDIMANWRDDRWLHRTPSVSCNLRLTIRGNVEVDMSGTASDDFRQRGWNDPFGATGISMASNVTLKSVQ
jgi:hypothetical protein